MGEVTRLGEVGGEWTEDALEIAEFRIGDSGDWVTLTGAGVASVVEITRRFFAGREE